MCVVGVGGGGSHADGGMEKVAGIKAGGGAVGSHTLCFVARVGTQGVQT